MTSAQEVGHWVPLPGSIARRREGGRRGGERWERVLGPHPQGIRMKDFKKENKKIQDRTFWLLCDDRLKGTGYDWLPSEDIITVV